MPKSMKLVFGIGTGRCGTQALTSFLNLQKINARHESLLMPWNFDSLKLTELINSMLKDATSDYPIVAEVNFSLLNYVEAIMQQPFTVKVFCLQRDRTETIRSWLNNQKNYNFWSDDNHSSFSSGLYLKNDKLSKSFPKYGGRVAEIGVPLYADDGRVAEIGVPLYAHGLEKEEAIAAYYDDYYTMAQKLEAKFPDSFRIFDMKSLLNEENEQIKFLDFLEISQENRFTHVFKNKIDDKAKDEDIVAILENLDSVKAFPVSTLAGFDAEAVKFLTYYNLLKILLDKDDEAILSLLKKQKAELISVFTDLKSNLKLDASLIKLSRRFIAEINLDAALYNYFSDTAEFLKKEFRKKIFDAR